MEGSITYGINNKGLTRGQGRKFISASGKNSILPKENGYAYRSGIVVEVISDPKSYFSKQKEVVEFYKGLEEEQQKSDASYSGEQNLIHKVPRNSIICKIIDNGKSIYTNKDIVCFPFFSPHISLPIKPGEHVWILEEIFDDFPRYYWLSRKHSAYYNDNVNVSNHEREIEIYSNSSLAEGIDAFTQEQIVDMHSFTSFQSNTNFSISSAQKNELTNEPVPEIAKKCGDLTLQGSNNALIHITTEKFTGTPELNSRYEKDLFSSGKVSKDNTRTPLSPAIDICVLRKKRHLVELSKKFKEDKKDILKHQTEEKNTLSIVENTRGRFRNNENYEVNKFDEDYYTNRDKDPTNCGARLYMSNNCNIDSIFNIADTELSQEIFTQYGGAVLAGYSEHIRFVSEGELSSFRVVKKHSEGETFFEIDNDGSVKIGSKEGKVESEGGVAGMEPFVKGNELQAALNRIIAAIDTLCGGLLLAGTAKNLGFDGPHPGLLGLANDALPDIIAELSSISQDLPKFKSSLIKGE
jgi:hypothetical protein